MRASFPIHCSKSRQRPRLIGDVHIRGITYGEVFGSTASGGFLLEETVCSCERFSASLGTKSQLCICDGLWSKASGRIEGAGGVEMERLQDRALITIVSVYRCSGPVIWRETSYLKDVPLTHIQHLRCPFQCFILFSLGPGLLLLAAVDWKISRMGL